MTEIKELAERFRLAILGYMSPVPQSSVQEVEREVVPGERYDYLVCQMDISVVSLQNGPHFVFFGLGDQTMRFEFTQGMALSAWSAPGPITELISLLWFGRVLKVLNDSVDGGLLHSLVRQKRGLGGQRQLAFRELSTEELDQLIGLLAPRSP